MDRDAIIRRGNAAEQMLSEDGMKALGEIEADLITDWSHTNPNDTDGREGIWRMVKCLELFQLKLESWRASGQLEKANLERAKRDRLGQQDA